MANNMSGCFFLKHGVHCCVYICVCLGDRRSPQLLYVQVCQEQAGLRPLWRPVCQDHAGSKLCCQKVHINQSSQCPSRLSPPQLLGGFGGGEMQVSHICWHLVSTLNLLEKWWYIDIFTNSSMFCCCSDGLVLVAAKLFSVCEKGYCFVLERSVL